MNETVNGYNPYHRESAFRRWWNSRNFIQQRLIHFSASLLVMILCFPLYYMGFFGGVPGPLSPESMGDTLAGMGVTRIHCIWVFLSLLIIAIVWNWIFTLVSFMAGARYTCTRPNAGAKPCGARVRRTRIKDPKTGKNSFHYICETGHKRPEACFNPIRKGMAAHLVWIVFLIFFGIVFFL